MGDQQGEALRTDSKLRRLRGWWGQLGPTARARLVGGLLIVASVAVTIWLGVRSTSKAPPTPSENAVLVILAGVLQIGGGATIAKVGRADPSHARSSVRRLLQIARRTSEARKQVEAAYDEQAHVKSRPLLGQVSVHLSYIEDAAVLAVEDWTEFHRDALRDIVEAEAGTEGQG